MFAGRIALPVLVILPVAAQSESALREQKEAALGKQLATELRQRTTPIESPAVMKYVEGIGRRLAAQMPRSGVPFSFAVIAEDPCASLKHEPTALPGGYVFVPAALLVASESEGEFAGMLAHSMAHVVATGQISGTAASIPLIFVGGRACSGVVSDEKEADALAVRAMADAGFNPRELLRYVERIAGGGARVANITAAIAKLQPRSYATPEDQAFANAREEVLRITAPARRTPPSLRRQVP